MKALVTGAGGFVGSHLALRLLKEGHEVVTVDNFSTAPIELHNARFDHIKDNVVHYNIDISDYDSVIEVFHEHSFDKIFHLAACAGVRDSIEDPIKYEMSNCLGTVAILEAARRSGVGDLVITSSSSVYGESENVPFKEDEYVDSPISIYAYSKRACELLARTYNNIHDLNITCIRPFTCYGPYGRPDMAPWIFTEKISRGETIDVFNHGKQRRDFTHVSDIVDGYIKAGEHVKGYNIYNLGRGEATELMDFISYIEQALDVVVDKNFLPAQLGDVTQTHADISKARKELGYDPKVDTKKGIQDFAMWYRTYSER